MYIELLEKLSYAFDSIPDDVKERLPGFKLKTYNKIKELEGRLKKVVEKPLSENFNQNVNQFDPISSNNKPLTISSCHPNDNYNGFGHSDSESILNDMQFNEISNAEASTPNYQSTDPLKKAFPCLQSKRSISLDVFSPLSDASKNTDSSNQSNTDLDASNQNKRKGKFVFKKASLGGLNERSSPIGDVPSKTLSRLNNATDKLKPLPVEKKQTYQPMCNSSVKFQPPQMTFNKPCTLVSPIVKENLNDTSVSAHENENIDSVLFEDDVVRIANDDNSVVNISDSFTDTLPNSQTADGKEIPIDDDGWQEYRVEDFMDTDEFDFPIEESSLQEPETSGKPDTGEPEVVNLMEVSMTKEKKSNKYEGMGDFAAGTRNDGITGN